MGCLHLLLNGAGRQELVDIDALLLTVSPDAGRSLSGKA